ncbi:hypothetical protein D2W70_36245 [Burkholderia pseudomallei]|nr:hypothetical protein D2W70_36245 [Burkholderia pseudomallei]RIV54965.1 hypothetical protein D2W49_30615 [Burkholderia pseudomallei]
MKQCEVGFAYATPALPHGTELKRIQVAEGDVTEERCFGFTIHPLKRDLHSAGFSVQLSV